MPKVILVIILGLLAVVNSVNAGCGNCSTDNFAACVSNVKFKICKNGKDGLTPLTEIYSCDAGEVCTAEAGICKPATNNNTDCGSGACNTCVPDIPFACVSKTEFAICDSTNQPGKTTLKCSGKKFCSMANYEAEGEICTCSCQSDPTCENDVRSKPAVEDSCSAEITPGAYPNVGDTTCKTYVLCELVNEVLLPFKYSCPSGRFFDKVKKLCVSVKPSYCTTI